MALCPKCGSAALHRSSPRLLERLRIPFVRTRPQRCAGCRWRGWMMVGASPVAAPVPIDPVRPGEVDLAAIDLALSAVPVLGRSPR